MRAPLGIRWTIGNVSDQGFEALRLSIWGARRIFGASARYLVCVNTVPLELAREKIGEIPSDIEFLSTTDKVPLFVRERFDEHLAEGVGWKFAPLRVFPNQFCLALDNDCILWEIPPAIRAWLDAEEPRCLIAEDVRACFGIFADLCGPAPRNSGIRGLPPGFDLERALRQTLAKRADRLESELDEQGLQVAAVSLERLPYVVSVSDVTICSPFPPHLKTLGRCGVHFVGLNTIKAGWDYLGKPGEVWLREHWEGHRGEVERRVFGESASLSTSQPSQPHPL